MGKTTGYTEFRNQDDRDASSLSSSSSVSSQGPQTFYVAKKSDLLQGDGANPVPFEIPEGATVKLFGIESGLQYTIKDGVTHMIKPLDNAFAGRYFTDTGHLHRWVKKRNLKLDMRQIYEEPKRANSSDDDEAKEHPYFTWAKEYLLKMKDKEVEKLPDGIKERLKELREADTTQNSTNPNWRALLKDIMQSTNKLDTDEETKQTKKIASRLEARVIEKKHGKVKALAKKIRNYVEAKARQTFKGKHRSTLNESVILEYLSGEILRAKGFATHQADIVTRQDPSSNKKVLALDITFLQDFKTLEQDKDDSKKPFIMDGCLVVEKDGSYKAVPGAIKGLPASEMAFRMLDDYDAFGSNGANKGVIDEKLQIIDTGNSFSGKGKKLRDNFTVEGKDPLKNFSLYSNQPHSHRMAGVILENKMRTGKLPEWLDQLSKEKNPNLKPAELDFWLEIKKQADAVQQGADLKCFDKMIDYLKEEGKTDKSMLKILKQVEKERAAYLERSEALCKTFEEKLKLNPIQIDFLQKAEIACSESIQSKMTKDGKEIKFDPPHITKHFPMEWKKDGDNIVLIFNSGDHKKDQEAWKKVKNQLFPGIELKLSGTPPIIMSISAGMIQLIHNETKTATNTATNTETKTPPNPLTPALDIVQQSGKKLASAPDTTPAPASGPTAPAPGTKPAPK